MTVIYQTTITRIGQNAPDALDDQMLITFREGAPADIEDFAFSTVTENSTVICNPVHSLNSANNAIRSLR